MADIRAFRGFRYDLGKVGPLAGVVAPPYDVIDSALQQQLYDASPYNAIRVELTKAEPGDTDGNNRYTRAASTLKDWLTDGGLQQDTARSLYVYEQEFTVEGKTWTRRGFLARVRLEPFGTGRIFPHEQTLSGPKADRLKLYQATGFNISPVFGLYPDEGEVFARLAPLMRRQPPIEATDHLGVINRLWVITDSSAISAVIGLMGPKPVFIADGHHRYETGLRYLEERRAAGEVPDDEAAPNFCLMMLVGMSDPGLIILPTHRLVSGLPPLTKEQLQAALAGHFEIVGEFGTDAAACWEHVELEGSQSVLGFGTVADNQWFAVQLTDPTVMETLAPDQSAAWRGLAVSLLHKLVLEKQIPAATGSTGECRYVHLMQEVMDAVAARECQLAVLVPPVAMSDVESIAGNREKMPPKSTYFYPKLLTGMVFNSLKRD
ncbi:MAG: DUF1015 domain-containing protein [Bacteroidales bacterium]|nr:DUF1015 domain-containing protein [Bacteroidales bacterium]